ncbi:MAG: hypothetical protein IJ120_04495 [Solobacterium sp.]|nr:hypothetical protein [Solobacterium sp.]
MSKRKKKNVKPEIEKETEYYDLKKEAVNALAEADESNSPEVSEEELKQYRSGGKINIPIPVRLLFIKFWFAGAVCYFFIWGLGLYLSDTLDTLFVTAIALGVVTDILTNNVIRFFARTEGENDGYIMVTKKGFISYVLNILYACLLLFCVYTVYTMINAGLAVASGAADKVTLGVEPILFGLLYLGFDQLFIAIKHRIVRALGKETADA